MSTFHINPEKYSKGVKFADSVNTILDQTATDIVYKITTNAAAKASRLRRNTIMKKDLMALKDAAEDVPKKIHPTTQFGKLITENMKEQSFKFSNGVKKQIQQHTEAAIFNLIQTIRDKDEGEQLTLLRRGLCIQELPDFAVQSISFKSAINPIQKIANPTLLSSEAAKVHLQQLASNLASLLAYQSGQQDAKTISEKDINIAATTWLPKEYAATAIETADTALARFTSSDQKNIGRRSRAGVAVSVSAAENILRAINTEKNINTKAPVYFAGILQGFFVELLKNTVPILEKRKKKTLTPLFINQAINERAELVSIFSNTLDKNKTDKE